MANWLELHPWKGVPSVAHRNRHVLHPADRYRVKAAIERTGSYAGAARELGVNYKTLANYVKRCGITVGTTGRMTARQVVRERMRTTGVVLLLLVVLSVVTGCASTAPRTLNPMVGTPMMCPPGSEEETSFDVLFAPDTVGFGWSAGV